MQLRCSVPVPQGCCSAPCAQPQAVTLQLSSVPAPGLKREVMCRPWSALSSSKAGLDALWLKVLRLLQFFGWRRSAGAELAGGCPSWQVDSLLPLSCAEHSQLQMQSETGLENSQEASWSPAPAVLPPQRMASCPYAGCPQQGDRELLQSIQRRP